LLPGPREGVEADVIRRWIPLMAAAAVTGVLASGVAFAAEQVASPGTQPAPTLKNAPTATLVRMGITLAPAAQPPYCGLQQAAVRNGWLKPGSAGCAIGRDAAEAAARRGGQVRVVEAVLARVSMPRQASVGRNHLAWLLVTQGGFSVPASRISCAPAAGQPAFTCTFTPIFSPRQLVMVDGLSGQPLGSALPLGARIGAPLPFKPLPSMVWGQSTGA
jgi:hypothetical protein